MSEAEGGGATPALAGLEAALEHHFNQPDLLAAALTHSSLLGTTRVQQRKSGLTVYERLEFLGDRVLGLVVAEWLYQRFPAENEGALAKRHAALVQREALHTVAEALDLWQYLRMTVSEREAGDRGSGERSRRTVLADACEAVIGALYLDGGLEAARRFIRSQWAGQIETSVLPPMEPKTALQEWAQGQGKPLPVYELLERSGPDHAPQFVIRLTVAGLPPETATGASKRDAERAAARALLARLAL